MGDLLWQAGARRPSGKKKPPGEGRLMTIEIDYQ
jgi:hypothetical protein